MTEFQPDEKSVARAEKLSARLMSDLQAAAEKGARSEGPQDRFSEQRYAKETEGVPVNDVVAHIGQMAAELALARRSDGPIPCFIFSDGELAPISVMGLFGTPWWSADNLIDISAPYPPFPYSLHRLWQEVVRRADGDTKQIKLINPYQVPDSIQRGLTRFLSYRFAGYEGWREWILGSSLRSSGTRVQSPSGAPPPPPGVGACGGLQVQVSCSTPGLRIHIAPAYFINWVVFGSPTSPVTSYVLPGRYVFAGDGPMLPKLTRDKGVFAIPPTYHPFLVSF